MTEFDAPGLSWAKPTAAFWRARPERHVRDGYEPARIRLPGHQGDGRDEERAALCRRYQADLLRWVAGQGKPTVEQTTWGYVIDRFLTDRYSPLADVKANTAASYRLEVEYWRGVLEHTRIAALTYHEVKTLIGRMKDKGRSQAFIHRKITHLRLLASYAAALRLPGGKDAKEILGEVRVSKGAARSVHPTRDQIEAIVAKATDDGMLDFAAGVLLQYEFALRAVDVFGQWLDDTGRGGVRRGMTAWADGLTWDMFAPDLSSFEKVISKTAKSLPEPYVFDLTPLPDLRARLEALRLRRAIGPVLLARGGLPYTKSGRAQAWRRYRTAAGVPEDVWLMDARAGALTEARQAGADPMMLRDAGQHASVTTTDRYLRGRSDSANKVVQMRRKEG